ncbi:Phage tail assembly chaperone protein [uncultured Caudovirales phage]|uniref:Phage tail assembly chaperone protein n=1 Tax=uncultured Caudovirales phage TaxID=2100421 RepID=A0A6J5KKU3_9CAUD|nr:Phage tail assembly chaperone protein [uncultured Caudovirales phage]
MNNALISPLEQVYSFDGILIGIRIAEVSQTPFEVAEPLYWVECADEVVADQWYFQSQTASCQLVPLEIPLLSQYEQKLAVIIAERNLRLSASDWTQLADVIASHDSAWLNAWNVYRQALRDLPASITEANIDTISFPIPPQ